MLTRVKQLWELPESAATDESVFLERRQLCQAIAAGPILLGSTAGGAATAWAAAAVDPTADLYPVKRNERYTIAPRKLTEEKYSITYNNFYEFGSHKRIANAAQKLKIRPWTVTFDGLVEKQMAVDFDTLIRHMPLEERLYRFRCVEAWSMAIPWSGFPMKALVDFAKPLSGAKYVVMETAQQKENMPGLKQFWYPWPYTDGLTIEEATHELAFIATGMYGKPIPRQNGAPLRLAVPWKYGFKNIKSLVRFTFTDKQPVGYWEKIQGKEYGFWANVNPKVDHPRWTQSSERVLGSEKRVPTLLYNGYAEEVAGLYAGMEKKLGKRLFM